MNGTCKYTGLKCDWFCDICPIATEQEDKDQNNTEDKKENK